jgi:hypothetical protein
MINAHILMRYFTGKPAVRCCHMDGMFTVFRVAGARPKGKLCGDFDSVLRSMIMGRATYWARLFILSKKATFSVFSCSRPGFSTCRAAASRWLLCLPGAQSSSAVMLLVEATGDQLCRCSCWPGCGLALVDGLAMARWLKTGIRNADDPQTPPAGVLESFLGNFLFRLHAVRRDLTSADPPVSSWQRFRHGGAAELVFFARADQRPLGRHRPALSGHRPYAQK